MRGIECAVQVVESTGEKSFLAETLRRCYPQVEGEKEQVLAATLAYAVYRRLGLWKHIIGRFSKRPWASMSKQLQAILLVGTAGIIDVESFGKGSLINALVELTKHTRDAQAAPFVNGILGTVSREGAAAVHMLSRTGALRDLSLVAGVPGWVSSKWRDDFGTHEAKELIAMYAQPSKLAARVSPGADLQRWADCGKLSVEADRIKFDWTPFPPSIPGHAEGEITPMSLSSAWAVDIFLEHLRDGMHLLDMCAGRGVKLSQILMRSRETTAEAWDISSRRLSVAERELARVGASGRAQMTSGDSAEMTPNAAPDAILLDAPCSGSGTWRRHPEGKWRLGPEDIKTNAILQARLLDRAADIAPPGCVIEYCTCSVFRDENERAVGAVLARRQDLIELPIRTEAIAVRVKRGRPFGAMVLPDDPWTDGFYVAIFKKKG